MSHLPFTPANAVVSCSAPNPWDHDSSSTLVQSTSSQQPYTERPWCRSCEPFVQTLLASIHRAESSGSPPGWLGRTPSSVLSQTQNDLLSAPSHTSSSATGYSVPHSLASVTQASQELSAAASSSAAAQQTLVLPQSGGKATSKCRSS